MSCYPPIFCVVPPHFSCADLFSMNPETCQTNVRNDSRSNPNTRKTSDHIQSLVLNSSVLKSRNLVDCAEVSRDYYIRNYSSTFGASRKQLYMCKAHQLPQSYATIMKPTRSWPSPTHASSLRQVAAFYWQQTYFSQHHGPVTGIIHIGSARLSALLPNRVVFMYENCFWFSLGNQRWAVASPPKLVSKCIPHFAFRISHFAFRISNCCLSLCGLLSGCHFIL